MRIRKDCKQIRFITESYWSEAHKAFRNSVERQKLELAGFRPSSCYTETPTWRGHWSEYRMAVADMLSLRLRSTSPVDCRDFAAIDGESGVRAIEPNAGVQGVLDGEIRWLARDLRLPCSDREELLMGLRTQLAYRGDVEEFDDISDADVLYLAGCDLKPELVLWKGRKSINPIDRMRFETYDALCLHVRQRIEEQKSRLSKRKAQITTNKLRRRQNLHALKEQVDVGTVLYTRLYSTILYSDLVFCQVTACPTSASVIIRPIAHRKRKNPRGGHLNAVEPIPNRFIGESKNARITSRGIHIRPHRAPHPDTLSLYPPNTELLVERVKTRDAQARDAESLLPATGNK